MPKKVLGYQAIWEGCRLAGIIPNSHRWSDVFSWYYFTSLV